MHGVVAVHREDSAKRVSVNGVNQCHLLKKVIRKNIFNNSMNLVYLRLHLKSWRFCFS